MRFRLLAGKPLHVPGVTDGRLADCPARPNCVCSDQQEPLHHINPLTLTQPAEQAWKNVRAAVLSLPGSTIVAESSDYLRAECTSAVLGFVDDLELHLRPEENVIAVRSASRLGYKDFGVNRKRVEQLRTEMAARGIARDGVANG